MILELLFWFFAGSGIVLMLFGIGGTIFLPDLLMRAHASTKCGVTGTINILLAVIIRSPGPEFAVKILLIILFTFITAPLTAHMLGFSFIKDQMQPEDSE